jgi:hypothetical protein
MIDTQAYMCISILIYSSVFVVIFINEYQIISQEYKSWPEYKS